MKTHDSKKPLALSEGELAQLGGGALAYIREIEGKAVLPLPCRWNTCIDLRQP